MPASSPAEETTPYSITALGAALDVLRAVGQEPDLTVPQLAAVTGLTKSKVYRIIRTLESRGFVYLSEDHGARLGSASLVLGRQAEGQFTLTQAAQSVLNHLHAETHENVYLMIREGTHALVLDLRTSPHPVRAFARVGSVSQLHAGGAPKVLLAYAPESVINEVLARPLDAFTPSTINDPTEMKGVLADIRRDRFHATISDLQDQVYALAVPVFNHQDEVVAALSVAGPLMRFNEERRQTYEALLREGSAIISQRLGR